MFASVRLIRIDVWSYDFLAARTHDGRPLRMLAVMDEFTRECLALDVERRLNSEDVLDRLTDVVRPAWPAGSISAQTTGRSSRRMRLEGGSPVLG